jgi:hypothetical protein
VAAIDIGEGREGRIAARGQVIAVEQLVALHIHE